MATMSSKWTARSSSLPPTLSQVAERAGVSLKTASRAINGEPRVAAATRQRVLEAASELGFQLNRMASLLARGIASNMVGLITGDLANPFYASLAKGIELELRGRAMQLSVASSDEDPTQEQQLIGELVNRQVRALILVSTVSDHSAMQAIQERGIPVVFADRSGVGIEAGSVVLDNQAGSRAAVEHLIGLGHRSVGFIGDLARLPTHHDRFAGYVEAMTAAGLDPTRWVHHGSHNSEAASEAANDMLKTDDRPTALFTANNRITVGALQALNRLDAPPALVGFDDFELADLLGVTVVAHDAVAMGRTAARLSLATTGGRSDTSTVVMPTWLIARGSGERRPRDVAQLA